MGFAFPKSLIVFRSAADNILGSKTAPLSDLTRRMPLEQILLIIIIIRFLERTSSYSAQVSNKVLGRFSMALFSVLEQTHWLLSRVFLNK